MFAAILTIAISTNVTVAIPVVIIANNGIKSLLGAYTCNKFHWAILSWASLLQQALSLY